MRRLLESLLAIAGLTVWGCINRGVGYLDGYYTAKCEDVEEKKSLSDLIKEH